MLLTYGGERAGELAAACGPASRGSPERIWQCSSCCHPLAVALHATALTEALQASRGG